MSREITATTILNRAEVLLLKDLKLREAIMNNINKA